MLPEVIEAMQTAAGSFVDLEELMEAAGRRVAQLIQCEFAVVTNGCAAAICQIVAACLAGTDAHKMELLPDTSDSSLFPRVEVIVQKKHRGEYDHAVRMAGGTWVEVETLAELEAACSERTALLYALGVAEHLGEVTVAQVRTRTHHCRRRRNPLHAHTCETLRGL